MDIVLTICAVVSALALVSIAGSLGTLVTRATDRNALERKREEREASVFGPI